MQGRMLKSNPNKSNEGTRRSTLTSQANNTHNPLDSLLFNKSSLESSKVPASVKDWYNKNILRPQY